MKARIIVTWKCTRACALCCNTFPSVRAAVVPLGNLRPVWDAEEVCITGGEPLLVPELTRGVLLALREDAKYTRPIWLYSSIYREALKEILPLVDGVQYTLHASPTAEDVADFEKAQALFTITPGKHNRLKIDCSEPIMRILEIDTRAWSNVRVRPFMTNERLVAMAPNGGVPNGEVLYDFSLRGCVS